ncbi:BZ3500_MvSof-1268-A1-R1_Chr12-1g03667 [Microbotryum saponariae]|uniref:BZ3500_MvSof-1268-A1-R1_Chr12-1g03667 protein n=1 Tax=Microbotryum saponariae TaxID=289078 RepID=A0A2X0MKM2_9BASI|nr:BZ3500_MvSof-1268-A1-R1_Chr12-1g03667 [Microbotryum saponariae]
MVLRCRFGHRHAVAQYGRFPRLLHATSTTTLRPGRSVQSSPSTKHRRRRHYDRIGATFGGIPTYRPDNGELESGLPTYCETTTFSYTSGLPVGSAAANSTSPFNASCAVPADHPMYAGPAIPVGAFTRNEGGVERSGMGMGLPGYTAPTTTEGHTNGLTTTGQGNATPNRVATPEPPKYES